MAPTRRLVDALTVVSDNASPRLCAHAAGATRARRAPSRVRGRRDHAPSWRVGWVAALAVVSLAACATRAVPDAWPRTAPASPEAPEAAPAPGPYALTSDPPLPDAPTEGWSGLAPLRVSSDADGGASSDATMPPGHHHMHHGG
ncbi:MAG: hypothetical protein U0326_37270 [Polyangiales bacterium]